MIITFLGFKGSGKSTAAAALKSVGFHPLSYGDSLKDTVAVMFGWKRSLLEGDTLKSRVWRETVDIWWADKLGIPEFTPRYALERVSVDTISKHFHPELWVLNVERKLSQLQNKNVVIVDARHRNQIMFTKSYGSPIIRIKNGPDPLWYETALLANRGDQASITAMKDLGVHEGEYEWIGYEDYTIENVGSKKKFKQNVITFVSALVGTAF